MTLVGANRSAATTPDSGRGGSLSTSSSCRRSARHWPVYSRRPVQQGRLDHFDGVDIDAIAAILVGGAAIQGGEGSAIRTAIGAVFIAALQNLMVLRGFSFGVRVFFVGLAILVSVSAFTLIRNRRRLA